MLPKLAHTYISWTRVGVSGLGVYSDIAKELNCLKFLPSCLLKRKEKFNGLVNLTNIMGDIDTISLWVLGMIGSFE